MASAVHYPHPSLKVISHFFSTAEQSLLLRSALQILSDPRHTDSQARRKLRPYRSQPQDTFYPEDAYHFLPGHFDGVIKGYREVLVPSNGFSQDNKQLGVALQRLYSLLPASAPSIEPKLNPPPHLIMHLLHLSTAGEIFPHVDNLEAFGQTIVGASLGSSRVMRFAPVKQPGDGEIEKTYKPFEVLVEPGSVYIQTDPLRTHYTHSIPDVAQWEGKAVGGEQRLSIMLRSFDFFTMLPLATLATLYALAQLGAAVPVPSNDRLTCEPNHYPVKPGKNHHKPCPEGWILSLVEIDICVEIGTEHHTHRPHPTSTSRPHHTSTTSTSHHHATTTSKTHHTTTTRPHHTPSPRPQSCPSGKRWSSLLEICIDIDIPDILNLGGGIKLGGGSNSPSTTTPCNGRDDPRALVGLCVYLGPGEVKVDGHIGSPDGHRRLPACKNRNDPDALLNLCLVVDTDPLLGSNGAIKLGSAGAHTDRRPACGPNDDPLLALCVKVGGDDRRTRPIVDLDAEVGGKKKPLVDADLNLGGGLKLAAIGDHNRKSSALVDVDASVAPKTLKANVDVAGAPIADVKLGGHKASDVKLVGNLVDVKLGGVTETHHADRTCPVGQLLHLGICVDVKADVQVGNLVKVDADAKAKLGV